MSRPTEIRIVGLNLPPDMADAYESFKLSILRHRLDGWREVSRLDALDAAGMLVDMLIREERDG